MQSTKINTTNTPLNRRLHRSHRHNPASPCGILSKPCRISSLSALTTQIANISSVSRNWDRLPVTRCLHSFRSSSSSLVIHLRQHTRCNEDWNDTLSARNASTDRWMVPLRTGTSVIWV